MTPEYEAARLEACRELAASRWPENEKVAMIIRQGRCDRDDEITKHFPAYDAGYARALADAEKEVIRALIVRVEEQTK
jgi:hypothetical protein